MTTMFRPISAAAAVAVAGLLTLGFAPPASADVTVSLADPDRAEALLVEVDPVVVTPGSTLRLPPPPAGTTWDTDADYRLERWGGSPAALLPFEPDPSAPGAAVATVPADLEAADWQATFPLDAGVGDEVSVGFFVVLQVTAGPAADVTIRAESADRAVENYDYDAGEDRVTPGERFTITLPAGRDASAAEVVIGAEDYSDNVGGDVRVYEYPASEVDVVRGAGTITVTAPSTWPSRDGRLTPGDPAGVVPNAGKPLEQGDISLAVRVTFTNVDGILGASDVSYTVGVHVDVPTSRGATTTPAVTSAPTTAAPTTAVPTTAVPTTAASRTVPTSVPAGSGPVEASPWWQGSPWPPVVGLLLVAAGVATAAIVRRTRGHRAG